METQVIKDLKEIIDKEKEIINKETQVIEGLEEILLQQQIGQPNPEKQTIALTVEAHKLYDLKYPPNQTQIDKCCVLEDALHVSPVQIPLSHFKSEVYLNQKVTWSGETKDPNGIDNGYSVRIERIEYEHRKLHNDMNFFKDRIISRVSGLVEDDVLSNPGFLHKLYVYSIHFIIYGPKGEYKDYVIDPKLCGNT